MSVKGQLIGTVTCTCTGNQLSVDVYHNPATEDPLIHPNSKLSGVAKMLMSLASFAEGSENFTIRIDPNQSPNDGPC